MWWNWFLCRSDPLFFSQTGVQSQLFTSQSEALFVFSFLSGLNFQNTVTQRSDRPDANCTASAACVFCISMATRRQTGVLGGGGEADHGGGERSPHEAAAAEPARGLWGRGSERGGGGHLGVSSGPDEASGDPGGRAGHTGVACWFSLTEVGPIKRNNPVLRSRQIPAALKSNWDVWTLFQTSCPREPRGLSLFMRRNGPLHFFLHQSHRNFFP